MILNFQNLCNQIKNKKKKLNIQTHMLKNRSVFVFGFSLVIVGGSYLIYDIIKKKLRKNKKEKKNEEKMEEAQIIIENQKMKSNNDSFQQSNVFINKFLRRKA